MTAICTFGSEHTAIGDLGSGEPGLDRFDRACDHAGDDGDDGAAPKGVSTAETLIAIG
jgi:hypothetical protein